MTKTLNSKHFAAVLIAFSALCLPVSASAETVQVPVGQQGKQQSNVKRPRPGMQQSKVEELFGRPIDWTDSVGDPPISSWIYPEFVVYFEYDHVLHSVLKHTPQRAAAAGSDGQ